MSHSLYSQVNLYDSQNTVWQEGNTTFVLTHESKLQILKVTSTATRLPIS